MSSHHVGAWPLFFCRFVCVIWVFYCSFFALKKQKTLKSFVCRPRSSRHIICYQFLFFEHVWLKNSVQNDKECEVYKNSVHDSLWNFSTALTELHSYWFHINTINLADPLKSTRVKLSILWRQSNYTRRKRHDEIMPATIFGYIAILPHTQC